MNCNLQKIYLPSNVSNLGTQCFANNGNLKSIDLSRCTSLEEVPAYLFVDDSSLSSISLPSSITIIHGNAFENTSIPDADWLSSLTNLKIIENQAFQGCGSLSSVKLPSSLSSLSGKNIFKDCNNLTYENFDLNGNSYGSWATNCVSNSDVAHALVDGSSSSWTSSNDIWLFLTDDSSESVQLYLPSDISSIKTEQFEGQNKLGRIIFPSGRSYHIEDYAFKNFGGGDLWVDCTWSQMSFANDWATYTDGFSLYVHNADYQSIMNNGGAWAGGYWFACPNVHNIDA